MQSKIIASQIHVCKIIASQVQVHNNVEVPRLNFWAQNIFLTLFKTLIFVMLFWASPECFTSKAMSRQYASVFVKHFVLACVMFWA